MLIDHLQEWHRQFIQMFSMEVLLNVFTIGLEVRQKNCSSSRIVHILIPTQLVQLVQALMLVLLLMYLFLEQLSLQLLLMEVLPSISTMQLF